MNHPNLKTLSILPLNTAWLSAAVEFDAIVFGGQWSQASYAEELARTNGLCLGITDGDNSTDRENSLPPLLAFGCVWHILDELHLILLGVHPQYRCQSLGLILLLSLMQHARNHGLQDATLEVRASNQAAIALYEKVGFMRVGHRPNYYPDTGEAALLMWCKHLQSVNYGQQLQQLWIQTTQQFQQRGWALEPCV